MKMTISDPVCRKYNDCASRTSIPLQVDKSLVVRKTNTLRQFDEAKVVGIPSPVGKIPIMFYMREGNGMTRRGLLYYGDYDTVSYVYPEYPHADWCEQPYDLKYDHLDLHDNGKEGTEWEGWYERKHGILELVAAVWRRWYNGQVMFRPQYKIQGCGRDYDGYPAGKLPERNLPLNEVRPKAQSYTQKKKTKRSCNCGKGA